MRIRSLILTLLLAAPFAAAGNLECNRETPLEYVPTTYRCVYHNGSLAQAYAAMRTNLHLLLLSCSADKLAQPAACIDRIPAWGLFPLRPYPSLYEDRERPFRESIDNLEAHLHIQGSCPVHII